jgi:hypothetical protein
MKVTRVYKLGLWPKTETEDNGGQRISESNKVGLLSLSRHDLPSLKPYTT